MIELNFDRIDWKNLTILRWQTLYPLYHVCGFLEYINSLILAG